MGDGVELVSLVEVLRLASRLTQLHVLGWDTVEGLALEEGWMVEEV